MHPSRAPKPGEIREMFDRLAPRYDLFNQLSSFGMDSVWRKKALEPVKPGMRVLDLGCGTGDLCLDALKRLGNTGEVVGLDFSKKMLDFASRRAQKQGFWQTKHLRFVNEGAQSLPLSDDKPYDMVISGFVLRNLYEMIDRVLEGVRRSLKGGGQISFLDFTEPPNPVILVLWRFYMNSVVALYGKILFGKDYPDFYMTESAKRFVKPVEFVKKLEEAGFKNIQMQTFMFGIITLYQAQK